MRKLLLPYLLLAFSLTVGSAAAQSDLGGFGDFGGFGGFGDADSNPVTLSAEFTSATDDQPALLMLTAEIIPEWHVFSITQPKGGPSRTKIQLADSQAYHLLGEFQSHPAPKSHIDQEVWKGLKLEEHEGKVTWYVPIQIAEGVDPASLTIAGVVKLQACKESCMPLSFDFEAKLGKGVEIGPVKITKSAKPPTTPKTASGASAPATRPASSSTPPPEAGIYRAEQSVVTWYGWLEPGNVEPGGRTYLYLQAKLTDHWHINAYSKKQTSPKEQPTLIALRPQEGFTTHLLFTDSPIIEAPSLVAGGGTLRYHNGFATWVVPIAVSKTASPGNYRLEGLVGYQACEANEAGLGSCELSKGLSLSATLQVGSPGEAPPSATTHSVSFSKSTYPQAADLSEQVAASLQLAPGTSRPTAAGEALRIIEFQSNDSKVGFVGMLGAALLGGLILNLMPCVLPVIGLKIMSFAKQGGESRFRIFALNMTYALGLLSVFMLLATLASLAQLGFVAESVDNFNWGELNTLTWFKVSMASLVFVMALSFLGVWEIPLPGFAGGSTAADLASREGYGGAFAKGILTTILATPCSGPFLGPVFGYTIGQPASTTFAIFFCVGLGMSLPYLVIGASPSLVQWIPKPGAWMETFKQFMSFVLLGTVVYLMSTLSSEYFVPTFAFLVALWFACWLGGRQPITVPFVKRLAYWGVGLLLAAVVGVVGFTERETELAWQPYTPVALAEAQAEGRTVLVDFTANWCPTCHWNLATAIDVREVFAMVKANDIVALKADWTDEDENIENALGQLRSRSIPLLAIYPANRPGEVIVLRDIVSKKQVLQALAQAVRTNKIAAR